MRHRTAPVWNFGAGQIAVMYAGGFLQPKLDIVESFVVKKALQARTKAMYLRGRDSILDGLRLRHQHQGFEEKFESDNLDDWLRLMGEKDIPYLYWGELGLVGSFRS